MSTTTWISKEEERVAELVGRLERQLHELRQLYNLDTAWLKAEIQEMQKALHYPECWDTSVYPTFLDALKEIGCSMGDECLHKTCHYETERKLTEQDTP